MLRHKPSFDVFNQCLIVLTYVKMCVNFGINNAMNVGKKEKGKIEKRNLKLISTMESPVS